jgi:hypothetical protein
MRIQIQRLGGQTGQLGYRAFTLRACSIGHEAKQIYLLPTRLRRRGYYSFLVHVRYVTGYA